MRSIALIFALLLGFAQAVPAMDPPDRAAVSRGRSAAYIDPALGIGNTSFDPALVEGLRARLSGSRGPSLLGFRSKGLPATGSPKVLVLLISFDEYPARPGETPEYLRDRIFGAGGEFPYESLTAYYRRSSYGKLNIGGNVLGWYNAGRRADVAETREGREALIKKALQNFKDHDFSQYDSNGDGMIDYFAVIWTGPIGEWATFWWGVQPTFSDKAFTIGGKTLGAYSWQGVAAQWEDPQSGFKIRTLAHETGHALGLPDYYDYKKDVGPNGGLGFFDMMDSTRYDHNCFSKFMLGWVEPRVVTAGGDYTLRPAENSGECLMLVPAGRGSGPFSEFFLVENRRKTGNDTENALVRGGLAVWHVDARLNAAGNNFLYNNQEAEHKLLKLMEADGLEEIETKPNGAFSFMDLYLKDRALGPATLPSSRLYDGTDTGISLLSRGGDEDSYFTISLR